MDNSYTSNQFLFGFQGRVNRAKCWYAWFASMMACAVFLSILAFALAVIFHDSVKSVYLDVHAIFGGPPKWPFRANFSDTGPAAKIVSVLFYALGTPIFIAGVWFLSAATMKRLHDRDRSGWWIIPFFIVPPLFNRFDDLLGDSWAVFFLELAFTALSFWGFIEVLFLKGTRGPNRFGPDPLAPVNGNAHCAARWDQQSELESVPHVAGPTDSD